MDELQALFQGFAVALSPVNIGLMFVGILLGVLDRGAARVWVAPTAWRSCCR